MDVGGLSFEFTKGAEQGYKAEGFVVKPSSYIFKHLGGFNPLVCFDSQYKEQSNVVSFLMVYLPQWGVAYLLERLPAVAKATFRDPTQAYGWKLDHFPNRSEWGSIGNTGDIHAFFIRNLPQGLVLKVPYL